MSLRTVRSSENESSSFRKCAWHTHYLVCTFDPSISAVRSTWVGPRPAMHKHTAVSLHTELIQWLIRIRAGAETHRWESDPTSASSETASGAARSRPARA